MRTSNTLVFLAAFLLASPTFAAEPTELEEVPEAAPEPEVQLPKITIRRDTPKVGRNDPCPCGGGKKFKNCHGA